MSAIGITIEVKLMFKGIDPDADIFSQERSAQQQVRELVQNICDAPPEAVGAVLHVISDSKAVVRNTEDELTNTFFDKN